MDIENARKIVGDIQNRLDKGIEDHEDARKLLDLARWLESDIRDLARNEFMFGGVTWASQPVVQWVSNLLRYRKVRHIGFSRGRVFVGIIVGSQHANSQTHELRRIKISRVTSTVGG